MRDEVRNGGGGRGAEAAQAARMGMGRLEGWGGQRARAECTRNMCHMLVTLDVSNLSGWVNTTACCRVEKRAYGAGRGASQKAGGRGAAQVACKGEAPTQGWGPRARAERT